MPVSYKRHVGICASNGYPGCPAALGEKYLATCMRRCHPVLCNGHRQDGKCNISVCGIVKVPPRGMFMHLSRAAAASALLDVVFQVVGTWRL